MTEVTIGGDGCRLVLRVDAYEFPDAVDFDDGNWLIGEVEMKAGIAGSFTVKLRVTVRANELAEFRDQLVPMVESLNGEATLRHMEEQVGCEIALKDGKGSMSAFVREHLGSEQRVWDRPTDQSFLAATLRDLDALLAEFPPRGKRGS
jgi:hypothetical protein